MTDEKKIELSPREHRKETYCGNCGRHGHIYKQCLDPLTSYGLICYRKYEDTYQIILIRRKDTIGYVEFLRGKYNVDNSNYIIKLLNLMTYKEKKRLLDVGNFDELRDKLTDFGNAIMEIPGKISDFFKGIFTQIKNFFIDAINSVIELVNKIPGVEIDKIERAPDADSPVVQSNVATTDEGQAMRSDDAYIVPKTPEVDGQVESDNKLDMFKNLLKMLMPQNNDLIPTMEANAAGTNIIDNSVKSVNQNNANQSISLASRNTDNSFHITNRYKDA